MDICQIPDFCLLTSYQWSWQPLAILAFIEGAMTKNWRWSLTDNIFWSGDTWPFPVVFSHPRNTIWRPHKISQKMITEVFFHNKNWADTTFLWCFEKSGCPYSHQKHMNIFGIMKHLVTMGVVNGGSRAYLVITRISRGLSRTHCPLSSFQIRHNGFTSQSKGIAGGVDENLSIFRTLCSKSKQREFCDLQCWRSN